MGASMSSGPGKDIELGEGFFIFDEEVSPCDLCARLTTELAALPWKQEDGSKRVDYACESCRAVLEVAQGLLDNEIKDENEIITTIALASYAGLSWTEVAEQPPEYFEREHPGLRLSRKVDGMPLFRMLPVLVEVVRYDGTELPKEIRVRVFSRSVQPEDLALQYKEVLAAERIPSDRCPAGSVAWSTEDASLTITIKPGAELHPDKAQYLATYPRSKTYHFPPVSVIKATYEALLGSIDSRTFRGYAYALGYHDRPQSRWKWTETNVVACLACCFGELDTTTRPAERRPRISRALNRHLLSPYNFTQLPESSWTANRKLREDVKEVGVEFMRASYLWQQPNRWPPTFLKPLS
jgi:hypothetical protein